MEHKASELKKDIAELEMIIKNAERQKVKDILSIELRKLISDHVQLVEKLKSEITSSSKTTTCPIKTDQKRYQIKLNNYGWDQSPKFVKFFVTLPGVHKIPSENISCTFGDKSVEMNVQNLDNKDYTFSIRKLLKTIDPTSSDWKIKTDMVVINAAKKESSDWSHVTEIEKKVSDSKSKKFDVDKSGAPEDSLMTLMKNMYEQGDDEMKRTIAKAWTEGQNKKNELGV